MADDIISFFERTMILRFAVARFNDSPFEKETKKSRNSCAPKGLIDAITLN